MVKYLAALPFALAITTAAPAAVISYSAQGSASATSNATGLTLQAPLFVPKFNRALGNLQSITISYSFAVSASASACSGGQLFIFTRIRPALLTLRDVGGATIASAYNPSGLPGTQAGPGCGSYSFVTPAVTGTLAPLTDTPTRRSFVGPGDYQFTYFGDPDFTSVGAFASVGVRYGATVAYSYLLPGQVPEPAAWALVIAGFGSIGASLRRRRAVSIA